MKEVSSIIMKVLFILSEFVLSNTDVHRITLGGKSYYFLRKDTTLKPLKAGLLKVLDKDRTCLLCSALQPLRADRSPPLRVGPLSAASLSDTQPPGPHSMRCLL